MSDKVKIQRVLILLLTTMALIQAPWCARASAAPQKPHNVIAFGAKGNGIVDDTAAIQRALNVGGEVYLPSGTYLLSKTLMIPSSVTLTGDGEHTVLKWRATSAGISINHAKAVTIEELTLTGKSSILVDIVNSADVHVEHVWFRSTEHHTPRPYTAALSLSGSSDVWVTNSDFTDDADFDLVANYASVGPTDRLYIQHNRIHGSHAKISIALFNTSNSVVGGNTIDQNNQTAGTNNDGYGILIYCKDSARKPPTGNQIVNNLVENTAGSGIYVQGSSDTVIAHNHIYNSVKEQNGKSLPAAAIAVNAGYRASPLAEHVSVLDNEIDGSGKAGIELSSTQNAVVRGNKIKHTTGQAIRLRFKDNQPVVKDNASR